MKALAAYGLLGWPLAMVMLPVYVQLPNFYAAQLGLSLGLTGAVFFAARLIDTVQDPWIGHWLDRSQHRPRLLILAALTLTAALAALLIPPALTGGWLAVWLALFLALTYTAHSIVNIAYQAWGARISDDLATRTRVAAWREGMGLGGVVLASVLPTVLASYLGMAAALQVLALVFAACLWPALWGLLRFAPQVSWQASVDQDWRTPLRNPRFLRLACVFVLNALAVSIPATLALFFIGDRLGLADKAGFFLAIYFVAGAAGLPVWTWLAARMGKVAAWRCGMVMACLAFVWAIFLPPGAALAYALVCLLSGLALGADLALPPSLLADVIPESERDRTAAYFGLWSLLAKLALALSGLALPLLALTGYRAGLPAGLELALVYAGLPCLLKITAFLLLGRVAKGLHHA